MALVTGCASYQVTGVAALDASGKCRLVQMTRQTGAVRLRRRELRRIADIRGGRRFGVFSPRPVTRFAGLCDAAVRVFLESLPDIFVARQACLRAHITRLLSRRASRKSQDAERAQNEDNPCR